MTRFYPCHVRNSPTFPGFPDKRSPWEIRRRMPNVSDYPSATFTKLSRANPHLTSVGRSVVFRSADITLWATRAAAAPGGPYPPLQPAICRVYQRIQAPDKPILTARRLASGTIWYRTDYYILPAGLDTKPNPLAGTEWGEFRNPDTVGTCPKQEWILNTLRASYKSYNFAPNCVSALPGKTKTS